MLHAEIRDALGVSIVSGETPAGAVLTLAELGQRHSVSRTVAREAVKILESLGLVVSKRRVGVIVQEQACWNLLDPLVIRWRLTTPGYEAQLDSLVELRQAIEPRAAYAAATHATETDAKQLLALAKRMTKLGKQGLGAMPDFLEADIAYHSLLLSASGNEMFKALEGVVQEILNSRNMLGITPTFPSETALAAHEAVAKAIKRRDPITAEKQSEVILSVVRSEGSS